MLITLDPSAGVPLFQQLADAMRAEIARGRLRAGEKLPSARELADSLEVNLHTVLKAYQQLRDEGLVDLRRGRGAVVTSAGGSFASLAHAVPALVAAAKASGVGLGTLTAMIKEEYSK